MKLSIIIPIYNKSKYLRTILQQLKDQTFSDFECLLIDDGSSDGSETICDEFAAVDPRFEVFHIPNGGVSHARNVGLDNAKGEYITFVDSDDEIFPNYLENLYECILHSQADIIISGIMKFWDHKEEKIFITHPRISGVVMLRDILNDFAAVQKDCGIFGYACAKVFTKKLVENIHFDENLRLAEDFDFFLCAYEKAVRVYFDHRCLYRYRQDAANSSMIVKDHEIDYFSQLTINLRYRDFLKRVDAYTGDNKKTVDLLLSNYVYFSAFYCPKTIMKTRLMELAEIQKREAIKFISGMYRQQIILSLLGRGHWRTVMLLLKLYRCMHNAIRKC